MVGHHNRIITSGSIRDKGYVIDLYTKIFYSSKLEWYKWETWLGPLRKAINEEIIGLSHRLLNLMNDFELEQGVQVEHCFRDLCIITSHLYRNGRKRFENGEENSSIHWEISETVINFDFYLHIYNPKYGWNVQSNFTTEIVRRFVSTDVEKGKGRRLTTCRVIRATWSAKHETGETVTG